MSVIPALGRQWQVHCKLKTSLEINTDIDTHAHIQGEGGGVGNGHVKCVVAQACDPSTGRLKQRDHTFKVMCYLSVGG